ncbi:DUF1254 domain-containing protein [Alginatibacterium sediminis]|uniref:DUF1254 domain-containing protein n=1 Tax=Alginatibacterium sediminis TaxID=2164068 RepID=A0A420EGX5_9ALTE|nr:DUF1254 domain-containing protein [Alginatibacterium sediminis]RKF19965.1 DUF1254 domain-containing protein [Alginatibacterium sediminis]
MPTSPIQSFVLSFVLITSFFSSTVMADASHTQEVNPAQQALHNEAYNLGISAYLWGSTLVRMEQISRLYTDVSMPQSDTSYRAPLNEFGHARRLSTPSDTDMPSANRDTLYSSAILDVSAEPIVLEVPAVTDRYYVINMFDMWHNLFKYVGTRETGDMAKQFLIVPPGWEAKQDIPRELNIIEAPTTKVWLWGRTQVTGEQDYAQAHSIQDQYKLTPLNEYITGEPLLDNVELKEHHFSDNDPLRFYAELGAFIAENPLDERQHAMLGQFKKIGLTKNGFNDNNLSDSIRNELVRAIEDGKEIVSAQANPTNLEMKDGWVYTFALDAFGDDNAMRSLIAHPYLGGQGPKEAIYPMAAIDTNGQALSGKSNYTMTFEKEPPVGAFWSVTVYDAQSKMLVENPIDRYAIGSLSDLKRNSDGSFTVQLSPDAPTDLQLHDNWLPTPSGNFYLLTRLYIPGKEILNMEWTVPGVKPQ